MPSAINSNLTALFSQRELASAQSRLSDSVERLSSGLRINRAKDDSAGLGISETLKSQVTAINQGVKNAEDSISVLQTAEGALTEASSILIRMKELATQARNASLSAAQRKFITNELGNLRKEINAIAERTTFNDLSLLKNSLRTEVVRGAGSDGGTASGAILGNGVRISSIDAPQANVGTYGLTAGTLESATKAASFVTAKQDPTEGRITNPAPQQFLNNDFEDTSTLTTTTQAVVIQPGVTVNATVKTITGWKIYEHQVKLGTTKIDGLPTPAVPNNTPRAGGRAIPNGDENTPAAVTYSSTFTVASVALGKSAELNSNMTTAVGGDVVHGPYMISQSTVSLQGGDEVSFKWQAQGGSDDYDIYAYLLNVNNGNTIELVNSMGVTSAFSTVTKPIVAGQEGNYKFVFVSGTYDYSGGLAAGARLYVDDVDIVFSAREGETQVFVGGTSTARKLTVSGEWEPGDEIQYTVKGSTSTVTSLTYVVTAENFTLNNDGTGGAIDPDSNLARQNIAASIAAQFESRKNVTPSATAASGIVTFAGASVELTASQLNRPLLKRDITFANADIEAGNRITLRIDEKDYSVIVGSEMSASDVAAAFKEKVLADYPGTATVSASTLTLQPGSQASNKEISVFLARAAEGIEVLNLASEISSPSLNSPATSRTINIHPHDVVPGREFLLTAGGLPSKTEYKVTVGTGDTASSIAQKLENLLDNDFGAAVGASAGTTVSGSVVTINAATGMGMANLALKVVEISSLSAGSAASTISARARDDRAREITISQTDIIPGTTLSLKISGKEYLVDINSADTANTVAYKLANQLVYDYPNDASGVRVTRANNKITLTEQAKAGLDDISLEIKKFTDQASLMMSAFADTGLAGVSQQVSLENIAQDTPTTFYFDRFGVSLSLLKDSSGSAMRSGGGDQSVVNTGATHYFSVRSADRGKLIAQVGSDSRDVSRAVGFADIRLNGVNQSKMADAAAFNNLSKSLDVIAASDRNEAWDTSFSDLENQIEAVITKLSAYRSDLGAQQNRLEFSISSLKQQSVGLASARSGISDTDFAWETARLTRLQIGQQASTAMLAQANQLPNVILALLR